MKPGSLWRCLVTFGAVGAAAAAAHSIYNIGVLRRPSPTLQGDAIATDDSDLITVSILIPARDEEHNIADCIRGAQAQSAQEVLILDDNSSDNTHAVASTAIAGDNRARIVSGGNQPIPTDWTGKAWALTRLAEHACGDVLVFIDADVTLAPGALNACIALMHSSDIDMLCPYPRQLADGFLPRLVQPLLQWSWLTFVPLQISENSQRESLAVGNGQFLIINRDTYELIGGHAGVASNVIEDVALARLVRSHGRRSAVVDGTTLATCRMYGSSAELVEGYSKSLWSAFGSPFGALAAIGLLKVMYLAPPLAALVGPSRYIRTVGTLGYLSAVAGRFACARVTQSPTVPDCAAHPLSITALASLTAVSLWRRRAGTLTWKGRDLPMEKS